MADFPGIGLPPKQLQTTPVNEDSGPTPEIASSRIAHGRHMEMKGRLLFTQQKRAFHDTFKSLKTKELLQ
jgi:hypothetical protein